MEDKDNILVLAVEGVGDGVLDGPNLAPLPDVLSVVAAPGEGDGVD